MTLTKWKRDKQGRPIKRVTITSDKPKDISAFNSRIDFQNKKARKK